MVFSKDFADKYSRPQLNIPLDITKGNLCLPSGELRIAVTTWRVIFDQRMEDPPTLGLDFVHANQQSRTIVYNKVPWRIDPPDAEKAEEATLLLGQNLGELGIGAVVWDCVSAVCSSGICLHSSDY